MRGGGERADFEEGVVSKPQVETFDFINEDDIRELCKLTTNYI